MVDFEEHAHMMALNYATLSEGGGLPATVLDYLSKAVARILAIALHSLSKQGVSMCDYSALVMADEELRGLAKNGFLVRVPAGLEAKLNLLVEQSNSLLEVARREVKSSPDCPDLFE